MMKDTDSTGLQNSSRSTPPEDGGFSPWQRLKSKRISYLTLPLLLMATITEFVILATGWKYQQVVCVPQGMGVTFFGIGPIGATILAVELLKLPLAIWTASRHGWQKGFMLIVGLPLICVLTFQLVKDMAVYEMGVALTPASQMLEKAMTEETRIAQIQGELAAIEQKKADREQKLAELSAKEAKAKADLEDSLKRNDDVRHDAIDLTEYQKKELSEVDNRESVIIAQFNSDTAQLTKAIADLRASREPLLERAARWNAEEARIENAYKAKLSDYQNQKAAYDKEKAAYDNAGFLKRQLLRQPVDPGVPPVREENTILKPAELATIDAEIAAKEAELAAVNNKRRERVAQVEADAHNLREQFDKRSGTKREEADKKREELLAAQTALTAEWKSERQRIDQELATAVQKVDGLRADLDAARKAAEGYYEAREASIRKTQVHRIATTVEIVRGLIKGERPMSIKMTAKERGDILTDQISMVRIWVYPVLAFIVAFLPTLMVEIGFSTVFEPEQKQQTHRLGFFGRKLHWVEVRAGRQKILRAERIAREAMAQIAIRDKTLAATKLAAERARAEKEVELQAAREELAAAIASHAESLKQKETEYATQSKAKEDEWVAKLASMADSLNRTVVEKDTLRNLQKSEVERQVQARQKLWSDRLAQVQQELDEQRATSEAERTAMIEEHHKKLFTATEDAKSQITQLRRQMSETELAASEKAARLTNELREATRARDAAETQLKHQSETLSLKLAQAQENAARELEKAARQEKHRLEWQELELEKKLRQKEEELEQELKQREQELSLAFEAKLVQEKSKLEDDARLRETERARQLDARALEQDAHWNAELQRRETVSQAKLKQREQQLQAQADERLREAHLEFDRQLEAQARGAEARLREELQKKETFYQSQLRQREQELAVKGDSRAVELLKQREQQLQAQMEERLREAQSEFARQLEAQARGAEARFREELQKKDTYYQGELRQREQELAMKGDSRAVELLKQREQQLQAQTEARIRELQTKAEEQLHDRDLELERQLEAQSRAAELRMRDELQQKEAEYHIKLKQREKELAARAEVRIGELQKEWAAELRTREDDSERRTEARVAAAETRLRDEAEHKEELFQNKLRQRDQQWQAKLDTLRAELQAQSEETLRRRGAEADSALRTLEAQMLEEMQQKEAATQAKAKQREQELISQVKALWEAEADAKMFAAMESFKGLLARTEKERDEARQAAGESARRVENLEKKLTEASSFLNAWRNGNSLAEQD